MGFNTPPFCSYRVNYPLASTSTNYRQCSFTEASAPLAFALNRGLVVSVRLCNFFRPNHPNDMTAVSSFFRYSVVFHQQKGSPEHRTYVGRDLTQLAAGVQQMIDPARQLFISSSSSHVQGDRAISTLRFLASEILFGSSSDEASTRTPSPNSDDDVSRTPSPELEAPDVVTGPVGQPSN